MSVDILDANLERFLRSTTGPVGRDLARRAERVAELARANATGLIIGIRSGRLHEGIKARVEEDARGLRAVVSTDARVQRAGSSWNGFSYPAYHDQRDRPWLTNALRDGYR